MTAVRDRLVLGVETSCDETAAAVVAGGTRVLSNVVATQHELHAEFRGVVPEIASRAHAERIGTVVARAVAEAGVTLADVHAVAVANRPGLIGSLLVGVAAARALAWSLGVALEGVDHVRAHLAAGVLHRASEPVPSPAPSSTASLGLVVSGGHTAMYRLDPGAPAKRIGSTRDDAVGEAYDKVAALLGLPYPGGPVVDRLARRALDVGRGSPAHGGPRFPLPISRLGPGSLDFSFSGLKTAVLYLVRGVPAERGRGGTAALSLDPLTIEDVCASFQAAAVATLTLKLERALDAHPDVASIIVGGGVSANSLLRSELAALATRRGVALSLPAMEFCLDNGAMIAALGHAQLAARTRGEGADAEPWSWSDSAAHLVASPAASIEPSAAV